MGDILPEIRITIRGNLIRPAVIVIDRIGIVEAAAAAEAVVVDVLTVEKWDIFRGNVRIAEAEAVAAVVEAADVDDREVEAAAAEAVVVDASTAEKWDIFRGIVRIAEVAAVEAVVDAIEAEVVVVDATEVAEEAAETIVLIADNRDTFRENVRKVLVEIIAEDFRFPGMVVERLKDRLWFLFRVSIGKLFAG